MEESSVELSHLLSNTDALFAQIYWFKQDLESPSALSHRGVSINYVDIKEKRDDFLRELKSTVINWVYSKDKYNSIYKEELVKRNGDFQNTNAYLMQLVKHKFRKGHPQGQFGELLLYNFIQHFFYAPPLLRKMSLTTNPALERNGADAIHYCNKNGCDLFLLGESKCYESSYSFNKALKASVGSIVSAFEDLENELILYVYDDFLDPELKIKAIELKEGRAGEVRFELVCLIAYNETQDIDDDSEEVIKANIEACLNHRWKNTNSGLYDGIRKSLVNRIHYVVFPIWELDKLLDRFED